MTTRQEFLKEHAAQLDAWNAAVGRLESKVRQASEETHEQIEARFEELRRKLERNRKRLEEARGLSEEAWARLRAVIHGSWEELTKGFEDVEHEVVRHLENETTIETGPHG